MFLKKLTLAILSFFVVLSLFTAVFGLSLQALIYPETYEAVFDKNSVYSTIEDRLVESGHIPRTIFAKQPVKPLVSRLLANTLSYLRGDSQELDLTIDVTSTVNDFFIAKASEIRVCEDGELPVGDEGIVCRPADMEVEEFLSFSLKMLNVDASRFSTVNLADVFGIEGQLLQLRNAIVMFRYAVISSFILSGLHIIMIVFLTRKSFLSMVEWVDFDIVAVAALLIGSSHIVGKTIPGYIPEGLSPYQGIIMGIVLAVLDLMKFYGTIMLGVAALLTAIAIGTAIFNRLDKKKEKNEKPAGEKAH